MELTTLIAKPAKDYELLDSGTGEKLERCGPYLLRRPDPVASWKKSLPESEWKKADAVFLQGEESKGWRKKDGMAEEWEISLGGLRFRIKPSAFKHVGVFPEQEPNWAWISNIIRKTGRTVKVLNLFGYTGGATLAAAAAGAEVSHVDGSKTAVARAKENAGLSGLGEKPIRFRMDDARKFVLREAKRGVRYDGIVMDPPAFGRGAKGEVWKIEKDLPGLLEDCAKILSGQPVFFLINGYAVGYPAMEYYHLLATVMKKYGGCFEAGELAIQESRKGRLLPAGVFARWSAK